MKKLILIFVVIFILLIPTSSKVANQLPSSNVQISCMSNVQTDILGNVTNISIENIAGGIGLTGLIKNNGGANLTNITVFVSIKNNSFVRLKTTQYHIPFLATNDSMKFHIKLFGIGLGRLTPLPEITIIAKTPEGAQKEVRIITMVIGSYTKLVSIYYHGDVFVGYTLFSPEYSKKTFLMNKQGKIVHTWESDYMQGLGIFLLENGDLLVRHLPLTIRYLLEVG